MADLQLSVRSRVYQGWKSLSLTSSVEQLAQDFSLEYFHQWAYDSEPVDILEGDRCTLKHDGETVLVGYVFGANIQYDASSLSMSLTGKSKTGDLCDCSAEYQGGQFKNQSLTQIANALVQPFGISVTAGVDVGAPFDSFSLDEGETVHEALARAARLRGLFLQTTPRGNLLLTRAAARRTKTVIQRGVNVLSGGRDGDWTNRHSRYTVKTQAPGRDEGWGESAAQIWVTVNDKAVRRHRPLTLISDAQEPDLAELEKRAAWERNTRAGKSSRLSYELEGWTNAEGVWRPNTRVRVVDPFVRVDRELLTWTVALERGDRGDITRLELVDPRAATVEPLSEPADRGNEWL